MERKKQKIVENMWCFHCEFEWETKDYYNCRECQNCKVKPTRIYRTSSTAFMYAHNEKHPVDYKKIIEEYKAQNGQD